MKKHILITILGFLTVTYSFCQQNMVKYRSYVRKADSLYKVKDFKESVKAYQTAFDANEGKAYPNDRYNAACSYALAGNSEKSFYHLFYSAEHPGIKYKNYNHITTDSDLKSLHKNKKWKKLIDLVKSNKYEAEKDFDKTLVAILDTVYTEDQKYRLQIREIDKKYGRESDEMKNHWKLIQKIDSVNLIKVKKILDERGWLGSKIIGDKGNSALFLVIQHSDLETQLKYLPMMREAVKKGNASGSSLALLEDRISLRQGNKQIYGSQIGRDAETGVHYVLPLIEPENVNERRAKVGLGKIEDYISRWNIIWDVKKHKERIEKVNKNKK